MKKIINLRSGGIKNCRHLKNQIIILINTFLLFGCSSLENKSVVEKIEYQLIIKDRIFQKAGKYPEFTINGKWTFCTCFVESYNSGT